MLLISLDFELYWGVRDVRKLDEYRRNLLGVRRVVPALLELFSEYDIHATWAIVGFLFFRNKIELLAGLPEQKPQYIERSLCPYEYLDQIGDGESDDPYHYAPSLIEMISKYPSQEIGSHTLSHYYCLEPGQNEETFRQDMMAAMRIAKERNLALHSLVFPRNQVNPAYLQACADLGISSYRGIESSWIYASRNQARESLFRRGLRLADAYLNLTGHNSYPMPESNGNGPLNLRSSRFLRPVSGSLKPIEKVRLRRIQNDLDYAAKNGQIYHLWWHPHNFGADLESNISFLRIILDHFVRMQEDCGMRSLSMGELALELKNARKDAE